MELKPGYKETEVGVIPEDWEVKRLGDIADIVMGQSPSSSNYNSRGDGLPLIQGNADIVDRRTIKRIFTMQITKKGREGDVLMSVRAPVGEISRALFDVCLGRGVCAIRFPNDFLYHFLIFLETSWAKHSKGSTFDSVNSADVKAVEVELPSDPKEQTAIATALSDADALLDGLDRLIAKKRDLKKAAMQQLLTGKTRLPGFEGEWELKTLGEIATIKDGTHQTPKYVASGVPFYSVEHVTSGDFNNTKFISIEEHRFLSQSFKIEKGDILMTRIGSIGDCKLIDWDVEASFYVSLALLKIRSDASSAFIAHYSNSRAFKEEVQLHSLPSAVPKKINLGPISNVAIKIPPTLEEQVAIATVLTDMDADISAFEQRRNKTKDIKQAMMQELLTGKTRLVELGEPHA